MHVVNAVLLKLRPKLYQSRYNRELSMQLPLGAIQLAMGVKTDTSYLSSSKCHTGTQA